MTLIKRYLDEEYSLRICKELGDDFYKSRMWKVLRQRALKIYGAECHSCYSQGSKAEPLHVDHIKPKSLYPRLALNLTNLQILCKTCNEKKSNLYETDHRPEHHKKFVEDYINNKKTLQTILLERTTISAAKKIKQKKKPRNLKKQNISKSERKDRKRNERHEVKLQVLFLQSARTANSQNALPVFINAFAEKYGADITNRLIKRCNLSHMISKIAR